ncbi:MAG: alpha/beta fold hydrolase [bacterium]|nr:alpha/beta fold hydrolase [bacterium]
MRSISNEFYPFDGKFIDLNGHQMHYLDEGDGDPVLMVHGNPTWSFYYRNLVSQLRQSCRTIVPDHIGCGLSDKPNDSQYDYTLRSRVDDLCRLVDSLDLGDRITLVVHDWGGLIGMGWAVRNLDRVKRLVVFNTAAFHLPSEITVPWQLRLVRNSGLGVFLVRRFNAFARGATWMACTRKKLSRELKDAYCAPYDSWENRIATARFVQDIPLDPDDPAFSVVTEVSDRLPFLAKLPTLICWGMKDFVFDHHFLDEWCRRFTDAEVHRFSDCGHYILEDASEEIGRLVPDFLDRNPIGSAAD